MQFRTFLFDLDGTLIDHFAAIHRAYAHTVPQLGLPAPTLAQVRAAVGGGLDHAMLNFVRPDQVSAAVAIYRPYWNATMLQDVVALPGALALLRDLHNRGAKLAIFTNKHGPSSRLIADHLGFTPQLSANLGAGDTAWLKPDLAFTAHALGLLHAEPASTLLVGDSPFDVQAALNSNLTCWGVATGTHTAAELLAAGAARVFADLPAIRNALSG